jgi:hypothetical protein
MDPDEFASFDQQAAQAVVLDILDNLATRPIRSAAAFRNAVLGEAIFAVNPLLDMGMDMAERIMAAIARTVREGRMIDFGHIPNAVVKAESLRAREAFESGDLLHPYEDNWLGVSSWEGGCNGYYIEPNLPDGSTIVMELYGVSLPPGDALMLYDAVRIDVLGIGDTRIFPAPLHDLPLDVLAKANIREFDERRAANSLDPLVTMLRLLADASVPIDRSEAPDKLNRQRATKGRYLIPPHTVVQTRDYVAGFNSHCGPHKPHQGGTHAPPVAHWRRAHLRRLSDRTVKVRSTKVNWRSDEELHRLFYRVGAS